jgi:hypothetical protein
MRLGMERFVRAGKTQRVKSKSPFFLWWSSFIWCDDINGRQNLTEPQKQFMTHECHESWLKKKEKKRVWIQRDCHSFRKGDAYPAAITSYLHVIFYIVSLRNGGEWRDLCNSAITILSRFIWHDKKMENIKVVHEAREKQHMVSNDRKWERIYTSSASLSLWRYPPWGRYISSNISRIITVSKEYYYLTPLLASVVF